MAVKKAFLFLVALALVLPLTAGAQPWAINKDKEGDPAEAKCTLDEKYLQPIMTGTPGDKYETTRTEYTLKEKATLANGMVIRYDVGGCVQFIFNFTFENMPPEIEKNNPDLLLRTRLLLAQVPLKQENEKLRTILLNFIQKEIVKKRVLADLFIQKQAQLEYQNTNKAAMEEIDPYLEDDIAAIKRELESGYVSAACGDAVCTIRIEKKKGNLVITYSLAI